MFNHSVRRILAAIPTLLAVYTFIFFLVRIVPGDPAIAILGDYASEETLSQFREQMGLNQPLLVQYFSYLGDVVRGNLGRSMITGLPVSTQLLTTLPYTLELTAVGVLFGIIMGIPLGIITGIKRNTIIDYFSRLFSLAGLSIPAFVLGILLIMLFSVQFEIFPVISSGSGRNLVEHVRQIFLPALTLGLIMTSFVTRITRSSLINVFNEDYIRTARAKGISEQVVVYKHALKNALIPIITFIGLYITILVGSSVMTEIVFSRPGLGSMIVGAMSRRDYNLLQSLMVVFATIVVFINILTDLTYGLVDPRIHYD